MSVELDPPELGFKRPFTQEVSQVLRLANPGSDAIAFKVKTTAPKQYCVRPNSGKIGPNSAVEVQVLLQAMKEDPPPDARCRDKFLVQAVAVDDSIDAANIASVWSNLDSVAKGSVQERKIRVNFLPADAATNGVAGHEEDQPPAYSSPAQNVAAAAAVVTPARSSAPSVANESMYSSTDKSPAVDKAHSAYNSIPSAAAVKAAIPSNQDELQRRLNEAQATIKKLQADAAEGLRQRNVPQKVEEVKQQVQTSLNNAPAPGGVPIQYVAAIALLVFLITYLLF